MSMDTAEKIVVFAGLPTSASGSEAPPSAGSGALDFSTADNSGLIVLLEDI